MKSLKWEDKQIGCAIKSESFLKGLALLPANAIPYNATAPYVVANGESQAFRANGARRAGNGSGRRFNNDGQENNGRKPAGKKGKLRNGSRDGGAKEGAGGTESPQNQNAVPQAPLKQSDFPVLGSGPVAADVTAEASSAASTPPLCNTPPPASDTTAAAESSSSTRGKVSYAQMALASVVAGNNVVKAQAAN